MLYLRVFEKERSYILTEREREREREKERERGISDWRMCVGQEVCVRVRVQNSKRER